AALTIARGSLGRALVPAVRRYSTMALWCFVGVAASGAVNAWLRLGGWDGLATRYGLLVIAKVVALLLLGAAGLAHRRRTIAVPDRSAGAAQRDRPFAPAG